ncbi:MAG: hypothetical protein M3463_05830 [Verrucomicrobiota bacterium]|nr:hypothetical protein [Verrucomicrobiota bacterium]
MMTDQDPARWQRVKELFQAALERHPSQRSAFLQAGESDASLRAEVEALLAADEQAASFLEAPLFVAPELLADDRAVLRVGQAIGRYQILSTLGAGGMGEVYLAQDAELGRKVALKVLAPGLIGDGQSHTRLLREARLASALDHPHILYDSRD